MRSGLSSVGSQLCVNLWRFLTRCRLAGLVSRNQGGEGVKYVVKGMNCDIMSSCDYRHSSVKRALQSSAPAPNTIVTPLQGALRMFDEFLSTM
jgi:hypothetical protein